MPVDIAPLTNTLVNFYYSNPYVAIGLAAALVLLVIFRPRAMLKTGAVVLALAVAVYFFTLFVDMAGTGRVHKKNMVHTVE